MVDSTKRALLEGRGRVAGGRVGLKYPRILGGQKLLELGFDVRAVPAEALVAGVDDPMPPVFVAGAAEWGKGAYQARFRRLTGNQSPQVRLIIP